MTLQEIGGGGGGRVIYDPAKKLNQMSRIIILICTHV
jgi:hypothetical protein